MVFFLFTLLHSQIRTSSAAPVSPFQLRIQDANDNTTLLNTELAPGWVSSGNFRGTADLLWTCVLTMTICVFTVIHVNVPPPGESSLRFFLRKTKWALVALLAPEISLTLAYTQWSTAKVLSKSMNLQRADKEKALENHGKLDKSQDFGMTYGFYAAMGGFLVDVSEIHDHHTLLTITPQGILFLADRGHFLEIDKTAIQDKSKADILAKLLVCIQVIWMIIQCIGRKVSGLPISLLEIHILVHVACALAMYVFWLKKPLDIQIATIIDSSKFMDVVALMLLESACGGDPKQLHLYEDNTESPSPLEANRQSISEVDTIGSLSRAPSQTHNVEVVTHIAPKENSNKAVPEKKSPPLEVTPLCTLEPGQSLRCGIGPSQEGQQHSLSANTIERWKLATKAIRDRPDVYEIGPLDLNTELLAQHTSNANLSMPTMDVMKRFRESLTDTFLFYILLLGLPVIYGGVHLSAWDFSFPTFVEHVMWKVSSIILMAGVFVHAFLRIFAKCFAYVLNLVGLISAKQKDVLCKKLQFCFFISLLALYTVSRMFLLVESFISVRKLPIGVYLTVEWSDYIPHL